jgi:hypothetical protein
MLCALCVLRRYVDVYMDGGESLSRVLKCVVIL